MSDVNNVVWDISTYLVYNDDGRFDVGYKLGSPPKFFAKRRFVDLNRARDFAKILTVLKNENSFVEIRGRFENGGHVICFLEKE